VGLYFHREAAKIAKPFLVSCGATSVMGPATTKQTFAAFAASRWKWQFTFQRRS